MNGKTKKVLIEGTYKGKFHSIKAEVIHNDYKKGTVDVRLNESDDIITDVPMVYVREVNEGILDTLKNFWDNIKTKAGYIFTYIKNKIVSAFHPINVGQEIQRGKAPKGTIFYPSEETLGVANELGIKLDNPTPSETETDYDPTFVRNINLFWRNVKNLYESQGGKVSVSECFDFAINSRSEAMNEALSGTRALRNIMALNEAFKLESDDSNPYSAPDINYNQLTELIQQNVYLAQQLDVYNDESPNKNMRPRTVLMVWGAPAIGKTAIIKQSIAELRKYFSQKLDIIEITAARLDQTDFSLPNFEKTIGEDGYERISAEDIPKGWLPMYRMTGDSELDRIGNEMANGKFKGHGGIIFIDEMSRIPRNTLNVLMTLVQDRTLGNYKLGSKWTIVCAGNRPEDSDGAGFMWEPAWTGRFRHVNYVPSFNQWISWAKEVGLDEDIIEFLQKNQGFWYEINDQALNSDGVNVSANPRAWEESSKAIQQLQSYRSFMGSKVLGMDQNEEEYEVSARRDKPKIISQFAGKKAAQAFAEYFTRLKTFGREEAVLALDDPESPILERGDFYPKHNTQFQIDMFELVMSEIDKELKSRFEEYDKRGIQKKFLEYIPPKTWNNMCRFIKLYFPFQDAVLKFMTRYMNTSFSGAGGNWERFRLFLAMTQQIYSGSIPEVPDSVIKDISTFMRPVPSVNDYEPGWSDLDEILKSSLTQGRGTQINVADSITKEAVKDAEEKIKEADMRSTI